MICLPDDMFAGLSLAERSASGRASPITTAPAGRRPVSHLITAAAWHSTRAVRRRPARLRLEPAQRRRQNCRPGPAEPVRGAVRPCSRPASMRWRRRGTCTSRHHPRAAGGGRGRRAAMGQLNPEASCASRADDRGLLAARMIGDPFGEARLLPRHRRRGCRGLTRADRARDCAQGPGCLLGAAAGDGAPRDPSMPDLP